MEIEQWMCNTAFQWRLPTQVNGGTSKGIWLYNMNKRKSMTISELFTKDTRGQCKKEISTNLSNKWKAKAWRCVALQIRYYRIERHAKKLYCEHAQFMRAWGGRGRDKSNAETRIIIMTCCLKSIWNKVVLKLEKTLISSERI